MPAGTGNNIRLQASDVRDLLAQYEQLTKKRIVFDNAVQGPLNISINTPVSADEAIKIIETALVINGFSLVPGDGNIVKVFAIGKSPRSFGIPIFSSLDQIPEGSDVVSVLFRLQFADSKELQQIVSQYVQPTAYTSAVALPNALLVTENAAVLRGIAKVISEADVPPAQVVSEFIQLERADAKDVIEKLEKIFERTPGAAGSTTGPGPTAARPPAIRQTVTEIPPNGAPPEMPSVTIDNGAGGLTEDTIIVGKIKLTADIRTNRIHVITRPANLAFVRKLVHEFDSNIRFGEPVKRPLKYISASDVLDVIVKAITEPGAKPEEGAATTTGNARPNASQTNGSNISLGGSSSSASGGSDTNISEGLSTQPVDTTPKAVTIGSTKIIADPRENTVIVLGNAEVRQKIFRLLDELDVRAPQVMLNTVIGELTLNNDLDLGIDALGLITSPNGTSSSTTTGTGTTGTGTTTSTTLTDAAATAATAFATHGVSLTASNGLSQFGIATRTLNATVQALESTGRFRVTNRPMIFTSNNKKAIIVSGSEIAVPTQTLSNITNGTTINNSTAAVQSSVEFKKVALQLEVVPLINSDREVSLDILQKLDSLSGTSTNVGGNSIPTIQTRYLRSNISVPNRATIVLGGLITRTASNSNAGVPVFGRIPVLGYLFKKNSRKMDRSELIILIRPVVMATPGETAENTKVERQRLLVEPDVEATLAAPVPTPNAVRFRYEDFKDR